jgi:hypothetical protein
MTPITASIAACLLWLSPVLAAAANTLSEVAGAPFSIATHPRMPVRVLPPDSAAGMAFAGALPRDVSAIDLLEVKWPKSTRTCLVALGQQGAAYGQAQAQQGTAIAVAVNGANAVRVPLPADLAQGTVGRLCVWPCGLNEAAELVFLVALATGREDCRLIGFTVSPAGQISPVDTGVAATVYGWFECIDFDGDGLYELVTSRNLDGMPGGLCYHAVRSYDPGARKYAPAPDRCKPFFQTELNWLQWLLDTRDAMQANPGAYLNQAGVGPAYVAVYQGKQYGFDTLIELPEGSNLVKDIAAYNSARRKALGLVRAYHDELAAWLSGGAYPSAWKMAR